MLILCNGMPRSGSTWSFNVVTGLLRRFHPSQAVHAGYDEDVGRFLRGLDRNVAHAVLKCHSLDELGYALVRIGAAKVVYTWRDIADVTVSYMRMFGNDFEHALDVIDTSLQLRRFHLESGNAVILAYHEIMTCPEKAIEQIARYLGLEGRPDLVAQVNEETSLERIREKVAQLSSEETRRRLIRHENTLYDPETLLNVNHIRDGNSGYGRALLSQEQNARIDELMRKWDLTSSYSRAIAR
jgi:hypothetical protein